MLVDTSAGGSVGSMSRYAGLVKQALTTVQFAGADLKVEHIVFGKSGFGSGVLSAGLGSWLKHATVAGQAQAHSFHFKPDVIHLLDGSYGYLLPKLGNYSKVATIHDLIPYLQAKNRLGNTPVSPLARWLVKSVVGAWKTLDALIAVTANSRNDLEEATGLAPDRIDVVHNALDPGFLLQAESNHQIPSNWGGKESQPLVLHVGNNAFYKNRAGVLRIFGLISKSVPARLVMAGAAPDRALIALVNNLGLQQRVEFVIDADDVELRALYSQAALLLFPSIYEGFGWPPLEAMACGCPVVCSSEGSLPEVVGEAALMAPAANEDQLAAHCVSLLRDPGLSARLAQAGFARANQFTLESMGSQLFEVYKKALRQHLQRSAGSAKAN